MALLRFASWNSAAQRLWSAFHGLCGFSISLALQRIEETLKRQAHDAAATPELDEQEGNLTVNLHSILRKDSAEHA